MRRKPPKGPIRADLKRLREQEKETARRIAELKAHIATAEDAGFTPPPAKGRSTKQQTRQHRPLRSELDHQRKQFLMWLGFLLVAGYFLAKCWK